MSKEVKSEEKSSSSKGKKSFVERTSLINEALDSEIYLKEKNNFNESPNIYDLF